MLGVLISPKASPRPGPNIEGRSFQGALSILVMRVVVGHGLDVRSFGRRFDG